MNPRERAEALVAEYLAALESGSAVELSTWLAGEPDEVRREAESLSTGLGDVLGALGVGLPATPSTSSGPAADERTIDRAPDADQTFEGDPGASSYVPPAPPSPAPPGPASARAWHYDLGDELGRGGNGSVHEVFDRELQRRLAMKVLSPEPDPIRAARRRERFRSEARLAGRLQHPGIIAIHELGRTPAGDDYFTMPKVEGRTLSDLIELGRDGDRAWSRTRLLDVLVRVAETMAFAHDRGVVHRDLKPANVMVGAFGETYVLDWGLARPVESAADPELPQPRDPAGRADLTGRGDVVGTPAYMPPEQGFGGDEPIGVTADVWALGATLNQVLTGEPPYGAGLDTFDLLRRLALEDPPPLDAARHAIPPELVAIRDRALRREAGERYADAGAFGRDLRAFLEGRVVSAYETGGWAELRKWVLRNRALAGALVAAVVAIVLGVSGGVWLRAEERAASLRFLDLQLVEEAAADARALFPADPERLETIDVWLANAEALAARGARHRAELEALDVRADALRERRRDWSGGDWTFADRDARWRHENLAELVAALEAFEGESGSLSRVRAARERLHGLWTDALAADAEAWRTLRTDWETSPLYAGPAPDPIPGLTPIGVDPASGLIELAVVGSGRVPEAPGQAPEADHAVVVAIVPGGRFEFGVAPGSDPYLYGSELDPSPLELEPFLLGRFELTRAQWRRLAVRAPEARATDLYPQSEVTQREALERLREWNLTLPTEAQWERAAEFADPFRGLEGDAARLEFAEGQLAPLLPAGERPRDAAGFGDLLGNLAEFCIDPQIRRGQADLVPGTGRRVALPGVEVDPDECVARGGHHRLITVEAPTVVIAFARPETRLIANRDERTVRYGVRVARSLDRREARGLQSDGE